jgi:hypothetical protein
MKDIDGILLGMFLGLLLTLAMWMPGELLG